MDKYTVYEVADILQTSHTTIYNKLNNKDIYKELRNFIVKQGKTRYVIKEGVDILKKHVNYKEINSKVDQKCDIKHMDSSLEDVGITSKRNFTRKFTKSS